MAQPNYIAFHEDPVLLGNGLVLMGYHMDGRPYFANCYSTTSYLHTGGIGVYSQPSYSERTTQTRYVSTSEKKPEPEKKVIIKYKYDNKDLNKKVATIIGVYNEYVTGKGYSDKIRHRMTRAVIHAQKYGFDDFIAKKHEFM